MSFRKKKLNLELDKSIRAEEDSFFTDFDLKLCPTVAAKGPECKEADEREPGRAHVLLYQGWAIFSWEETGSKHFRC